MKRNSTLQRKSSLQARKPWNYTRKPLAQRGSLQSRSTLKTTSTLKAKTTLKATKPMKKIGKVGKANIAANKIIRAHADKHGLDSCEVCRLGLPEFQGIECTGSFALTTAHKHKRAHYKGDPDQLSDPKEWVKACVTSHDRMEHDRALTDKVFGILRS